MDRKARRRDRPRAGGGGMSNYPPDMDQECIPICDALNALAEIKTFESCCGHGQRHFSVFFQAETVEALKSIVAACESGDWCVEAVWENGNDSVVFVLKGPIVTEGLPGGPQDFARWLSP